MTTLPTPGEAHALLVVSAIALGIMALVSIGLGWFMAGRVLRPLRSMTATARQISEVNLHERLDVRGPNDELKDLGDTIDGLLGRLETAFEAQRRFVANASHELRTPLAMMRTSVDVALGKPQAPPEVKVLASKLGEGLEQADKLLEGLLVLARAQRGSLGEIAEVSLPDSGVRRPGRRTGGDFLSASHRPRRDRRLPCFGQRDPPGPARRQRGEQRRPAQRRPRHGRHHQRHARGRGLPRDRQRGPGPRRASGAGAGAAVPPAGPDRVADNNGAGLGLSIVRAIATAHGGTLHLHARPEGGLRVVIELPVTVRV